MLKKSRIYELSDGSGDFQQLRNGRYARQAASAIDLHQAFRMVCRVCALHLIGPLRWSPHPLLRSYLRRDEGRVPDGRFLQVTDFVRYQYVLDTAPGEGLGFCDFLTADIAGIAQT